MVLAVAASSYVSAGRVYGATWGVVFDYATVVAAINANPAAGAGLTLSCAGAGVTSCLAAYEFFAAPTAAISYTMSTGSTNIGAGTGQGTAAEWRADATLHHPLPNVASTAGNVYAHWVDRTGVSFNTIAFVTQNAQVAGHASYPSPTLAVGQTPAIVANTATWTAVIDTTDPGYFNGATVSWQWYANAIDVRTSNGNFIKNIQTGPYTITGIVATPEPGSIGLIAAGLAGLLYTRRRKLA